VKHESRNCVLAAVDSKTRKVAVVTHCNLKATLCCAGPFGL